MNHRMLAAALVLALCTSTGQARVRPELLELPRVELTAPSGQPLTLEEMRRTIELAATYFHWQVAGDEPGKMTLTYGRPERSVTIRIDYDAAGYQIVYVTSEGMGYAEKDGIRYIHPKYNDWIQALYNHLRRSARPAAAPAAPAASAAASQS